MGQIRDNRQTHKKVDGAVCWSLHMAVSHVVSGEADSMTERVGRMASRPAYSPLAALLLQGNLYGWPKRQEG